MSENLLYEEIYQKTQDCGRTQFVKLLQQSQIKINQLEKENHILKQAVDNTYETSQDIMYEMQQENEELKKYYCKRNDCAGRLKENNKPTDSEVLTKFEKWINLKMKQTKEYDTKNYHNDIKLIISTYQFVLDKLQELKEGKK